jgi:hypothetical protein
MLSTADITLGTDETISANDEHSDTSDADSMFLWKVNV